MNIYAIGAAKNGVISDEHRSVLRSRVSAIWGPKSLTFHNDEGSAFHPEECAAVLVAGGILSSNTEDAEASLKYSRAMRWFSESTLGISLGVADQFSPDKWQRDLHAFDSLKLVSVRDAESARLLRQTGVLTKIVTSADLSYLQPLAPRRRTELGRKPVLGIVADPWDETIAQAIVGLESDFEIRHASPSNFNGVDICLTSQMQGVVLSVLQGIPFAALQSSEGMVDRECRALHYPRVSNVRSVWSEREALRELLEEAKPVRLRLAQRNIELMQAMLRGTSTTTDQIENGNETLLVWAAPDEYWEEAESLLAGIGSGFDCLVPSNCRVTPPRTRKRMAIPPGTLMHWAMFPEELRHQIEHRYDNTIVCHAYRGSKDHLADIAGQTGRRGWEYRLWTHSCESYS